IRCPPRSGCSRRMPGRSSACTGFPVWRVELQFQLHSWAGRRQLPGGDHRMVAHMGATHHLYDVVSRVYL
ncbi:hypothetical protein BO70DRAFT_302228, partial [Aspergillus heteromorphus CBS 117.55]